METSISFISLVLVLCGLEIMLLLSAAALALVITIIAKLAGALEDE